MKVKNLIKDLQSFDENANISFVISDCYENYDAGFCINSINTESKINPVSFSQANLVELVLTLPEEFIVEKDEM